MLTLVLILCLAAASVFSYTALHRSASLDENGLPVDVMCDGGTGKRGLEAGGPTLWEDFMADLRAEPLGAPPRQGPPVRATLQAAYEDVVARQGGG